MRPIFPVRPKRALHVTMAAVSLAAPATALAATAGQAAPAPIRPASTAPASIGLHVSARSVRFGQEVTVTGTAPVADAGRQVVLQIAGGPSAAWHTLANTRVGRAGHYRFRVALRRSGELRALIVPAGADESADAALPSAATPATGAVATSASVPVAVTARFAVPRRQFAILGSGRVRVSGRLLPAAAGRTVKLQRSTRGGWRTVALDRTGGRGGFSLRFRAHGESRLRVLFPGDGVNGRATAPAGRVAALVPTLASWYEDAGMTACGFHAGLGVANRTLPCGTHVTFSYRGRTVTAVVDDRGPYVGGREYDLNQTTAGALGFSGVGTVWASRA